MITPLDGPWFLRVDPDNSGVRDRWYDAIPDSAVPAPVPGTIQQRFPGFHGVAWYWTTVTCPQRMNPDIRILIDFEAVDYSATVWLGGTCIGSHAGSQTPFTLDATAAVTDGTELLLAVRVLNPTDEPIDGIRLPEIPHSNRTDHPVPGQGYNSGGIARPAALRSAPPVAVDDIVSRPDPATGSVEVVVGITNARADADSWLRLTVSGPDGRVIVDSIRGESVPAGRQEVRRSLVVPHHRLWDLHDPACYRLTAELRTDDAVAIPTDSRSVRFGFRDFRVVDGKFRLNGRAVYLRSTHTGNHLPMVEDPLIEPEFLRRDLINAKATGFTMVRFIAGMAWTYQLDLCDEIGLLVYEEHNAGWLLQDSPRMAALFRHATTEMILRDRNHPSVVAWGLLNETFDGPVFRCAVDTLPLVRRLDPTRLVLLGSGRWDGQPSIGSISNPGGEEWESAWGAEAPKAPPRPPPPDRWASARDRGGYAPGAGDAHVYPQLPAAPSATALIRSLGHAGRPVFLSEYGVGSLFDVRAELAAYQQRDRHPQVVPPDRALITGMAERFNADWKRYGMDDVYPFPEDLFAASYRHHSLQRLHTFDLIRANPRIVGYNLTGMLDHAFTGEGLWSFWRRWKPGVVDALDDGWAPIRWCLFTTPEHGYADRPVRLEAVLATDGSLAPGAYSATFRVFGRQGTVWQRRSDFVVTGPGPDSSAPFAIPVLDEQADLGGSSGELVFAASLDEGAAAAGGRRRFTLAERVGSVEAGPVPSSELPRTVRDWLTRHHVPVPGGSEVFIAGAGTDPALIGDRLRAGGTVLLPSAAATESAAVPGLRIRPFHDWLYHKECVARPHPVFAGLSARGLLEWDRFGQVLPTAFAEFEGEDVEVICAAFATGYPCPGGYASGAVAGVSRIGTGRLIFSTFRIPDNLGRHPAADLLFANLLRFASERHPERRSKTVDS